MRVVGSQSKISNRSSTALRAGQLVCNDEHRVSSTPPSLVCVSDGRHHHHSVRPFNNISPPPPAFLKTVVVQTFNFFVFRKKKNRKRNECGEEKEKDTPCQMSLAEMGSLSANEFCLCTLEIRESQYYYGQILNKHIPPKGQLCV